MLQRLLTHAAEQLDRAAMQAATHLLTRSRVASLTHEQRVEALQHVAETYSQRRFIDTPEHFFPRPRCCPELLPVGSLGSLDVFELGWDTGFTPFLDELKDRYHRHPVNARAAARLYTPGGSGRPAVILIHGYMCGQWRVEEKLWPIEALCRWGLDVVIMVLPFHGVRAVPGRLGAPPFPAADPRLTIEGFRQAIGEVRSLTAFLKERGAPSVGLMGMSLGGYTSALAASLDDYAFVVPMIPLGSIADFARDGGRLSSDPTERALEHRLLDAAYKVVSPLARPARVRGERALVITGQVDRVTPSHHAYALADHLGARLHVFHGGHLLQFGRSHAFRAVGSMLERLGLRSHEPFQP